MREANFLAEEMNKLTDYQVTLQIPAANLSANRKVRLLKPFSLKGSVCVGRVGELSYSVKDVNLLHFELTR